MPVLEPAPPECGQGKQARQHGDGIEQRCLHRLPVDNLGHAAAQATEEDLALDGYAKGHADLLERLQHT